MSMVVNSIAYRQGQRIAELPLDEISEVVRQPGTFVWMGLHEPDDALLAKIQEEFGLHELAVEDAGKAHQRPKLEAYGDSLFIVLKTAQLTDEGEAYGETHLFVGSHFLVSVRHGPSSSYRQVRARSEAQPAMLAKGPAFALYAMLDFVVDHYQPVVERLEQEFDALEESIFKAQTGRLALEAIYDMKRRLLELRNAAQPVADICSDLLRLHGELIPKELRVYFRDVQDHVARLVGRLDGMREMATAAMQVNLALVGVSQNDVVKRLAGWAAILALPTVVFSLYGMNFEAMPELAWRFGYPLTLAVTAVGCIYLYRRLRRAGWV